MHANKQIDRRVRVCCRAAFIAKARPRSCSSRMYTMFNFVAIVYEPVDLYYTAGKRASASEASLARLNQYVRVEAHTEPLNEEFLKQFNVVVLTEASLEQQEDVAAITRKNNISLVVADTRGLAGQIFCDFGENFRVVDPNGEEPLSVLITSITNDRDGVVACLTRHGFEDGDYVSFSEVRGMSEINNCPPMKVKVLGPHTFSIGDTTQFGEYTQGGVATQVKIPKDIKFKSFQESLAEPDFVTSNFAKIDRPLHLHLGFQALHEFQRLHSHLPRPWNKEDAEEVVRLARQKNARLATPLENIDERLITTLSYVSAGSLCPMQAVIGSIAAQEVMKACSGKFNPIRQWFYFDAFECLPRDAVVSEASANAMNNTRYAGQACVLGTDVQDELMSQNYFVVGSSLHKLIGVQSDWGSVDQGLLGRQVGAAEEGRLSALPGGIRFWGEARG
ncbi:hypothetical protein HPB51_004186 [Rhipicephalus microplus]|uniref:E1 ubiquitin-activating enzyme n=1 Tax=Rhipicephalus microplus TaxID=6941 RepID=A0A9J6DSL9_RHIMP|nr:hypothetical protein HPB51_004186 [Rhipicephalus microplus]